jgi:hypothetical protein
MLKLHDTSCEPQRLQFDYRREEFRHDFVAAVVGAIEADQGKQ